MFPFGVTFYPDQWPKENWEKELSKISEAGLNCIRFGEMAWNWVEPRDGQFSFEDLDAAMDLANKYGLKVILGIGTSQAPPWLIKKHPELRPVASDGALYPEYGPRPNICRDSRILKKYAERYIKRIVNRYSKHPAMLMWQIDNEPVYPPLDVAELKDFCHCQDSKRAFIDWAKAKYGTVEEANRAWGMKFWTAEFSDFSEVTPPGAGMWDAVSSHIYLDWLRFKTDSLHSWVKWMKEKVNEIDRSHKVGTNGFIGICPRVPDHDILSDGLDWYGWDVYPAGGKISEQKLAMMSDLWRSYTSGKNTEFHVTELQGGSNVRWGNPAYVKGPEIRLWTHQVIAHGAQALLYHAWRPPLFGSEVGGFGILSTSGGRTDRLQAIEAAAREIKLIVNELSGHKLIPQVAIAYLRSSDIETYQEQGPTRTVVGQWEESNTDLGVFHAEASSLGAHSVLWRHHDPVAFIFERHLEDNALPFQAILLPNPYILKEKHVKVLRKYVYDGGTLITEARFGAKDEFAHLNERPLIETLADVVFDHSEIISEPLMIPELNFQAHGFRDFVSAKEGVVFSFPDKTPAFIEKKLGKGRVLYATFSLFLSLHKNENMQAIDFLRGYLPPPPVKVEGSDNVEAVLWEDSSPLVYMINHSDEKADVSLKVPQRFSKAEEMLKKELFEIKGGNINMSMDGRQIKILHLSA